MLVVVQRETVVTGTLVAADGVLTDVLAAAVVHRTLVLVYKQPRIARRASVTSLLSS